MKAKKALAALTGAVLALGLRGYVPAGAEAEKNREDIVILYTNDIHCGVDMGIGIDGLALYKREMQAEYENVLLADAGDAIQGMPVGTLSKGKYVTELMNAVGYDAAVPGNHEFDYGMDVFMERADELSCGYICCNFSGIDGDPVFEPYTIVEAGDRKVGFVGVTTPETRYYSTPVFFQDENGEFIYSFGETTLQDTIQQNVNAVREEGADVVILLGHLGIKGTTEGWRSVDVAENTYGIDAIIDAHSHEVTEHLEVNNSKGEKVVITQTGTKLGNVGKMVIEEDGSISTELISQVPAPLGEYGFAEDSWTVAEDRGEIFVDSSVNEKLEQINSELYEITGRKIGETSFKLAATEEGSDIRLPRVGETNLGDLCADAYRFAVKADAAIVNGGGIRADILPGDMTYRDLLSVYPFNNMVCMAEVSGQQILDMLELGAKNYPEEDGSFCQVSGIEYTIDGSAASSVKLGENGAFEGVEGEYRVRDVYIGGEPLDTEKTYTLAAHDYFLKNGGDNYIFSGKCRMITDSIMSDTDCLAMYISEELGGIIPEEYSDPMGQGRIKVLSEADDKAPDVSAEDPETVTQAPEAALQPAGDAPEAAGPVPAPPTGNASSAPAAAVISFIAAIAALRPRKR